MKFGDYVILHGHRPNHERTKLRCAVCLAEVKVQARKRSELVRLFQGLEERRIADADRRGLDRRSNERRIAERRRG
jgi:hypothetical protein